MKKQSKGLLILLILLALLVGAFFLIKSYNEKESTKEEEDTAVKVIDIERDDIVKFTYDYNGETYTYEKVDDTWYYAEDHSINITQYQIKNMLTNLAPLKAELVIEGVTDMDQYGLADSERSIQFETEGASYIFEVGSFNSTSSVHYIRKPSEDTVYAVSSATVNLFNKDLEDLVDEPEEEEASEESAE